RAHVDRPSSECEAVQDPRLTCGRAPGPTDDIDFLREIEDGRLVRETYARRLGHRVRADDGFGALERPWLVVDVGSIEAACAVVREKAVALGEKVIERPRRSSDRVAARTIARAVDCGGAPPVAALT